MKGPPTREAILQTLISRSDLYGGSASDIASLRVVYGVSGDTARRWIAKHGLTGWRREARPMPAPGPGSELPETGVERRRELWPSTYQRRTPRELRRIPPADGVEHPWWAILDPDRPVRGQIEHLAGAITGPYLSREEAVEELAAHGYRYGPRAQVWCLSGHASPSWRALCEEPGGPNL